MRPNTRYSSSDGKDSTITIVNTNTGKKIETEVAHRTETTITVFLANEKIVLHKQGNIFVGNKFGMELVYDNSDVNK
jgi:hypothetical protein